MSATVTSINQISSQEKTPALPPRMRVLFITSVHRTGGWLAEAFASEVSSEIDLDEVVGSVAGLGRLREELFDVVLVSHEPGELDALALLEGYRTGVADAPIIVLGTESEQEMGSLCFELDAEAYVCVNTTTKCHLRWVVSRAIMHHEILRENARLSQSLRRRLQQEHDEASRLLGQQQALIDDLDAIRQRNAQVEPSDIPPAKRRSGLARVPTDPDTPIARRPDLPDELIDHYRELLRAYVIMGSGNLAHELSQLAELLTSAAVNACETMQLHLFVLEEMVQGLGSRSARHVMTRADLLVLEIMIHLAEGYRKRYQQRVTPARQLLLPGFEMPSVASLE